MKNILLIFGGESAEHEISVVSASNIFTALSGESFKVYPVGIDKKGRWYLADPKMDLTGERKEFSGKVNYEISLHPGAEFGTFSCQQGDLSKQKIDCIFNILHGPMGEDGSIQGLFNILHIPYVGADCLGSAVGMDKEVMKRLLLASKIKSCRYVAMERGDSLEEKMQEAKALGEILFVKPANMGSSVGVSKVRNEAELRQAIALAFQHDRKIIIEEFIVGREIEVAVMGNAHPAATFPGEIIPQHDFYSYEAKYVDQKGALLEIPAKISAELGEKMKAMAISTYRALCCRGLARVDFFLTASGDLYINEINTLPGFTPISMFPKLWREEGIDYTELLEKLITLAMEEKD